MTTPTTPRTINADVFRRARRAGLPLNLAAYVARPAALDLNWLSHYQSDGEWSHFDHDGGRFRVTVTDPAVIEGKCVSCCELVDAYQRQDDGMAWMTPDEYDATDHRALTVTLLDGDDEETAHEVSLWGVCGPRNTEMERLFDDRYLAETVLDLASEAADDADAADAARLARADATRGITIDRETLEAWAGRPLTGDEVERIDDALQHSSVPEAIATIAASLTDED